MGFPGQGKVGSDNAQFGITDESVGGVVGGGANGFREARGSRHQEWAISECCSQSFHWQVCRVASGAHCADTANLVSRETYCTTSLCDN